MEKKKTVRRPRKKLHLKFERYRPNALMNLAHAYIVATNPEIQGTLFFGLSNIGVEKWDSLKSQCEDADNVFYVEASMIVLSYARAITYAHRRWKSEIELAHKQFDISEKQMTKSVTLRVSIKILMWALKLLLIMGFGYALTLVIGRAVVPDKVTELTGVNLPSAVGALGFGVLSVVTSTIWHNRLWNTAASELSWCLGAAEEELERGSIEAFDLHWFQFCDAYKAYTGEDHSAEPAFISIMRGKLRARERWNRQRMFRMTNGARVVIELIRRAMVRKPRRKTALPAT